MSYYVIGPGGSKFGPADLATLNQWSLQGRIAPDTVLQDSATGVTILAVSLPGLGLSGAGMPPSFASQVPVNPNAQNVGVSQGQAFNPWAPTSFMFGRRTTGNPDPLTGGPGPLALMSIACGLVGLCLSSLGAIYGVLIGLWGLAASWTLWRRMPALGFVLFVFNLLTLMLSIYLIWHRLTAYTHGVGRHSLHL